MSHSVSSYVVYGLQTNIDAITKKFRIRSCEHDVSLDNKYCPECGKLMFTEESQNILGGTDEHEFSYFSPFTGSEVIVIGFMLGKTGSGNTFSEVKEVAGSMKKDILDYCQLNGIICDENNLKKYVMTHHSY
jgi:hypothetical protein